MKIFPSEKVLTQVFLLIISLLLWVIVFLLIFPQQKEDSLIFSYPNSPLEFAGVAIPRFEENFIVKERFDKEYLNVSYNLYQFFLYAKRMPLYVPYIEEKLEEKWLPDDLKYLPIAESALRNDVVSTAWAAGIWQFMPETAKQYGLIVNENVDERYHFEKSTLAALEYLEDLHKKFWDWPLALASYNRGQNAIQKALEAQKVDNYFDLYLNPETSRYVFRILAIKYSILDYQTKKWSVNLLIGGVYEKPLTKKIKISSIANLKNWAAENNYNYYEIKSLNPWILTDTLPEWNWDLEVMER